MNILFKYLYRDASNFKAYGGVVFENFGCVDASELHIKLLDCFKNDGLFISSQIRVPEVFLYNAESPTADDHCFHEYVSAEQTLLTINDVHMRSIDEFILEVQQQSDIGWAVFDPCDPFYSKTAGLEAENL